MSEPYWWTIKIIGAYDIWYDGLDNDSATLENDERGVPGLSLWGSTDAVYIFYEVLRDLATERIWVETEYNWFLAELVIHEVGHLLSPNHVGPPGYVMWAPNNDAEEVFMAAIGHTFDLIEIMKTRRDAEYIRPGTTI